MMMITQRKEIGHYYYFIWSEMIFSILFFLDQISFVVSMVKRVMQLDIKDKPTIWRDNNTSTMTEEKKIFIFVSLKIWEHKKCFQRF